MALMAALGCVVICAHRTAAELPGPVAVNLHGRELRRTVSLDGTWQIAEGSLTNVPAAFDREGPVPGLVDMAQPPFVSKAVKGFAPGAFWYRRTFVLADPLPDVGILRIGQSQYGIKVFVNGQTVGERSSGFVPMQFEVRRSLKPGVNEILVRVTTFPNLPPGNHRPALPAIGWDSEKVAYTPGISDSVELVLGQSPFVRLVQVVPDVEQRALTVHGWIQGVPPSPGTTVELAIRESKSGKVVAQKNALAVASTNNEAPLEARMPIPDGRLWSPEDPFLYTLQVTTKTDRYETRFGLRSFRCDPQTGHAVLNGKPYFMRGSNVCIYRFFDDPERGDLPWDAGWVRRLHRRFKDMHWNSLRYCIGLPPQRWYDVADEEGFLSQDEYPIWNPDRPFSESVDALTDDYRVMMESHWNHPSVVIGDFCNETRNAITGQALDRVRDLDRSNRPWENGWARSGRPTDIVEDHPYHYLLTSNPNPQWPLLKTANPGAGEQAPAWQPGRSPVIVNEYGGLWLNRDGTPTVLTRALYPRILGPNATAAQRRHLHALLLSADTEFFRSHRKLAGVLEFCALSYSRPEGATSDHWTERGLAKLEWDPEFYRYVRDAFAPVGLMVDFFDEKLAGGTTARISVVAINDLYDPWNGPVTLRRRQGDRAIFKAQQTTRIEPLGRTTVTFEVKLPDQPGPYTIEAELRGADQQPVRSVREVTIKAPRPVSLATHGVVTASSICQPAYRAENAVDKDEDTYWSSAFEDDAWLAVDLGAPKKISRVDILWETAYAKSYSVHTSTDGKAWAEVYNTSDGKGGLSEIRINPVEARYVRIVCTKRGTQWGNAVYELGVFEK
jgi:hypothetical protein